VLRAQSGDRAAFGVLASQYLDRVYRVAYSVVRNHEDAADIAQETLVRAYRTLDRFDPDRPLFPWLYQIARNLGINRIQRVRKREASLPEFDVIEARERGPAESLLHESEAERVRRAIAELPEHHRRIIELCHFDDCSYNEMAEILDIPVGTVMSRLYHARKRLQKVLESEELHHA
jgi:RNA polymerase sigma-70 factor (ECF subfamily)